MYLFTFKTEEDEEQLSPFREDKGGHFFRSAGTLLLGLS